MRKSRLLPILLLLCVVLLPALASANSPGPMTYLRTNIVDPPENMAYLDVLVPLDEADENYVEFSDGWIEAGLPLDSELAAYRDEEGYVSYSAHYKTAAPLELFEEGYSISLWDGWPDNYSEEYYDLLEEFPVVKFAAIDAAGSVIQISDQVDISNSFVDIYYHMNENRVVVRPYSGGYGLEHILLILLLPALLTIGVEMLVGMAFGMRPLRRIFFVNLVTNPIFNLFLLFMGMRSSALFVGEMVVVLIEYMTYRSIYREDGIPAPMLFTYTLCANVASAVIGMLVFGWF
ncbi:hypothetical protein LJC55_01340 [Eubacteriales bacterium OttesenSCG-928-N14]|nr:hypothetical protein [Eubacteriales bacterium OttesenSCG-928-N14]